MIRVLPGALAAIAAVGFTVAFAARLASPAREEQPRTPVLQAPVGGRSAPVVADPARLRSAAPLPVLHVPRATPTPAARTWVVAPEPPPAAPSGDEPAELPAAPAPATPAPVAPAPAPSAPAPPAPQRSPEPSHRGPIFDSSG
jgi:hypothetical protein